MSNTLKKVLSFALLVTLVTATVDINEKNEETKKINAYRLPDTITPISYDIELSKIDFENFIFEGSVKIDVQVKKETKEIVLHKGNLIVSNTTVLDVQTLNTLEIQDNVYNSTTEKLSIFMKQTLKPSSRIRIQLVFKGTLRDDMIGFYRSSYSDEKGTERWLAATQFESTHARHAFPCFDEPALKATFKIRISPPKGYGCLSNMPMEMKSGWCEFEKSKSMSTYLVAFVISDFKYVSGTDKTLKLWSRPNALEQAKYGVEIGVQALDYFAKLLKLPYQLTKMDMVAVPDFSAGAMENWGLITYRETRSLYDEANSPLAAKQSVASVIVHECTHMWFGNLVTPDWWSYLWLSEAFARYYQYMATNEIEKSWKMDQQFVVEQHQLALGIDSVEDSVPMTRTAITQSEIGKMGDSITYSKGASIVRMMERSFGTNVFNEAIRDYLKEKQYKSATPADLWKAFQKQITLSGSPIQVPVAEIMTTWTEKPGFPYITVTITPDNITFIQQRFLLRNSNTAPSDTTWWVPITWTSSSRVNKNTSELFKQVHWMSKRESWIKNDNKDDEWKVFNVDSTGFYRVHYDADSWKKIIKVLTSDDFEKIPVLNRAAIVDDVLHLARAELLPYETALQCIQYLRRETNYLPFKSAFTALDYLTRKFSGDLDFDILKKHVLSIIENIYNKLTYDDKKSGEDQLTILLRQQINNVACNYKHPDCIIKSLKYFAEWKNNGKPIPKNQRSVAYCAAIKYGSDADWEFLWKQYRNANVAAEQTTILNALGCSTNTQILEKYLLTALKTYEESRIRKQDISSVFSAVYSASEKGAEYILDFIEKHHQAIYDYHKNYDAIGSLISGALQRYPTKKSVSKLESMIKNNAAHVKSVISSLKKTLELAKFELNWFDKHSPTIINWIKTIENKDENTAAYRLPGNVEPINYEIRLTPFIVPNNFTFDGTVKITANVTKNTDKIVLHSSEIKLHKVYVSELHKDKKTLTPLTILSITKSEKYDFINIDMKIPIASGTIIVIEIIYTGVLNTEMRGFYRSSYRMDNKLRWLAATHLEPVGARRVFPCFDEPALKATFDISVDVPENCTAVSNMDVKSNTDGLWTFKTTPVMSTYLVAIVVSDFVPKSSKGQYPYSVWANPLVTHQLDYSLQVMDPIVKFFEKKLNMPYGLPKLDMVALPDFSSGAMENWGLLTFRETNMLYDPKSMSSLDVKQAIRNVIAHEIAHQWFGNIVSPKWWDYVWLSEGFARYFQYYAHTEAEASWNLETQFVVDHMQTSFSNDASTGTHPVTHRVYSPTEIRAIFDKISYAKAGSLIRMLEKVIGSDIFYAALHRYLLKCQFSTGTPEELFASFQEEINSKKSIDLDVSKFMNSWTKQSGFPVVNVAFEKNTAKLTQSRFFLRPSNNEVDNSIWIIPLNWVTRSNANFNDTTKVTWLNEKSKTIEIKQADEDWVILNVQQTGYYRVNYEPAMWRRIAKALNTEHSLIHEINRASLIDDLLNLGRAGFLDYDVVFAGTRYLIHETELGPWKAALTGFSYLNKRFAGRSTIYDSYKAYLVALMEPNFKRLGFEEKPNERHTDTLLRKLTLEWLCAFEAEECVNEAVRLFEKERNDEKFILPPNQRTFVYCTAIRHGKIEDWNYLWKKYEKSDYATEKSVILSALSCSKDPNSLIKLLSAAITPNSGIRLQDAKKVFTNVVDGGLVGIRTTIDFIEANYEKMQKYFNDDSIAKSTLSTISKRLSTDELFEKFDSLVKNSGKKMPSISKSLQSFLKRANLELNWYNEKFPKILKVLDTNNPRSDYRLPTFAKPEAYDIYLKPYFEERNFTFEGKVIIDVKIDAETSYIVLHANDLNIDKIYLADDSKHKIMSHTYNSTTHKLSIYFEKGLTAGTKLQLKVDYTGKLGDDMRGFYRSFYTDDKGNKKWIASTQFEPTYARRAFPCFDEPSFKANFIIHISRPKGYRTLSNMGSTPKQRKDGDDRVWDDYEKSILMSPYLVAFVVSDFEKVSAKSSIVSVWARPQLESYLHYASVVGQKSLTFLENFTKIEYPLKEMNFVAVPDFDMGAMENWGLVTFREYGLTFDVNRISALYRKYVSTVISHELVHMWFGDLVTCEWWDYTWLNEGFAEYISYLVSNSIEPQWQLPKQFVVEELQVALGVDSSVSSHPMNNKVLSPTEAQDGFDKIAYQKSASVLRMLHHSFGQQVFEEALQSYLYNHRYSVSRPEYLVAAIQTRLNKETKKPGSLEADVATVMNSWTTQAGYPVVNATRNGNNVILSQERFLLSSSNSSEKNKLYWIPITYTTESELNFKNTEPRLWLGKKEGRITLQAKDTWFILNVQEIGFYRVNYDEATWRQLASLLNSDKFALIDDVNRAQIIDDALNLARAGYLDYDIALDITKYLVRETSHLPWKAFFNAVAHLGQRIEGRQDIKSLYAHHILTLATELYEKRGFKENMSDDEHLVQLNRQLILTYACKYGHENCVKQAKDYFTSKSLTPNIAAAVYCTAIEHGTQSEWDILWSKYLSSNLATDYITILKALGCSKNATTLEKYLDLALASDSKIRRQDVAAAFSSVYTSSQIGLETALNYFQKNLKKLHDYYGNWHDVGSIFSSLGGYIVNEEHISNLEKLSKETIESEVQSSVESAIKVARNNLKWFENYSEKVHTWLKNTYDKDNKENEKEEEKEENKPGSASLPQILPLTLLSIINLFLYFFYY